MCFSGGVAAADFELRAAEVGASAKNAGPGEPGGPGDFGALGKGRFRFSFGLSFRFGFWLGFGLSFRAESAPPAIVESSQRDTHNRRLRPVRFPPRRSHYLL